MLVSLEDNSIKLQNTTTTNRKVPKETKLWTAPGPVVQKASPEVSGVPFAMTLATLVWDGASQSLVTLKKMIGNHPAATSVLGYKPWPTGVFPTKLELVKDHTLTSSDGLASAVAAACVNQKETHCVFELTFLAPKTMVAPIGLHVVNAKQISLAASAVHSCA